MSTPYPLDVELFSILLNGGGGGGGCGCDCGGTVGVNNGEGGTTQLSIPFIWEWSYDSAGGQLAAVFDVAYETSQLEIPF